MSQDIQSVCEWCNKRVPMYLLKGTCVPVETEEGLFSDIVFVCLNCLDNARNQQAETDIDAEYVCD